MRTLIRNARKEADAGKPPKSSRELFRLLREQNG
jgi:ribosome-associated protein